MLTTNSNSNSNSNSTSRATSTSLPVVNVTSRTREDLIAELGYEGYLEDTVALARRLAGEWHRVHLAERLAALREAA